MNRTRLIGVFLLWGFLFFPAGAAAAQDILILCYHNVTEQPGEDSYAVTPAALRSHLTYLKEHGYTPISLQEYLAASREGAKLPDKPVMLTFDDGYQSFYTKVFSLLKEYRYPAMLALVTSWLDYAPAGLGPMVTWSQVRELEASGLVSIASHSYDSHRFSQVTPQGDRGPVLSSLLYKNGQYESREDNRQRIRADLQQSQAVLKRELGHSVQAVVWPYGAYTQPAIEEARQAGFVACFALAGGWNQPGEKALREARRVIVLNNPSEKAFARLLARGESKAIKAVQLDLDMIYDPVSHGQTEENLRLAIERIQESQANTVYLQAFSDADGSGDIKSVYFYTQAAPVKADLFSHVVARLREEGKFSIYAWLPTLAGQWLTAKHPEDAVTAYEDKGRGWYRRATPFSPRVGAQLTDLVDDLVSHSDIDGILFQDDLYLTDFEDVSPAAKEAFRAATGSLLSPELLKQNPTMKKQWIQLKTETLTALTLRLRSTALTYRPGLSIARNIYPLVITQPAAEEWLAQNYEQFLAAYDYTVIMAYPYLEQEYADPEGWLERLAAAALANPQNAGKTVFKLQTYDWNKKRWLSAQELRRQAAVLKRKGVLHLAYYPENVFSQ